VKRERGSALTLVPAGVLVLIVLGAVALDLSIAFLGERELANATAAAANDAASALDEDALRAGDQLVLDPRRADIVARRSLAARGRTPVDVDRVAVDVDGVRVTVRASGTVTYVFAKAVPGAPRRARVEAVSTAELRTS
jgi:Flp pilus assembly protein TadG